MKRNKLLAALLLSVIVLSPAALTACGKKAASAAQTPITESPRMEIGTTPEGDRQAADPAAAIRDTYAGYWYGVFHLYEGTGEYVSYDDDVVAYFDFDAGAGNGTTAHVTMTGISDGRVLADLMVQIGEDDSWSVGGAEVFGTVTADLSHEFFEDSESMLVICGEAASDDSAFSFSINIRPWGMTWEDVEEEYPTEMPANYDDWYLPRL